MNKIIIAGGSGFLGQELISFFQNKCEQIIILSRGESKKKNNVTYINWNAQHLGDWCKHLENADVVINLCGKSVDCRYTKKNKEIILSSRINSTKIIGQAINACLQPPKLWINGASATIYNASYDIPQTEEEGVIGSGFSVEVCKAWEQMFDSFSLPNTRKVNLRISMVMGKSGGVFPVLSKLTQSLLGGTMGKGTQQVSWIHILDFCKIIEYMINNKNSMGTYNCVSPEPVTNKKMMQLLREKYNVKVGMPASEWMLTIGAFMIGTETELILKSRYSFPKRLLNDGFTFEFNTFEQCIKNL